MPKDRSYQSRRNNRYTDCPVTRVNYDVNAFMVEEKFDTWLDLSFLRQFTSACYHLDNWFTSSMAPYNREISPETCCFLQQLKITPLDIADCDVSALIPAWFINKIFMSARVKCHMSNNTWNKFITLTQESTYLSIKHQINHMLSNCSPLLKLSMDIGSEKWEEKIKSLPHPTGVFMAVYEDLVKAVDVFKNLHKHVRIQEMPRRVAFRIQSNQIEVPVHVLNGSFIITPDLIIWKQQKTKYLLDKILFLELFNKISETTCCLIYAHMCAGTSKPENNFDITVDFIKHLAHKMMCFKTTKDSPRKNSYENTGFKYLKVMEGLGVSELIRRSDYAKGWRNDDLAINLWKTVYEEGLDNEPNFQRSEIFQLFHKMTVSQIASVLGLVKLVGHPSIDIELGLEKLHLRTHENIEVDMNAVRRSIRVLKKDLFKNFHIVHKKYPNYTFIGQRPPSVALRVLLENDMNPISEQGDILWNRIPNDDWDLVQIEKTLEFDPIDNQLVLLKDKALGVTRSKVIRFILEDHEESVHDIKETKKQQRMEVRRALLAYLLSTDFSNEFTTYLHEYQQGTPWRDSVMDYLVIKLTVKELEEKPEGRLFGASPLKERNKRIVQEHNTKRIMDKYVGEQLMTPNELQMIRKLYSFRHLKSVFPHYTILQVSFDFSKWNNSMRSASIDVPGREILDRLFGTSIYRYTMAAYQNSLVYYKDRVHEMSWNGQEGGIEGLNQDTWSYIFIGGIKQALDNLGILYQLTVKGDDVRAALIIAEPNIQEARIKELRDTMLTHLQQLCLAMGWTLNPHECFVSLGVICTSKQYQYNDTWLPADDKKIVKCESLSNLVFPTVEDIISNIFSTAHSACSQATVMMPAFITASFLAARLLVRTFWTDRPTVEDITAMLIWPQILGGPGPLPLQTFAVRGENDMLSAVISLYCYLLRTDDELLKNKVLSILMVPLDQEPNVKQLLSDPYSIPLNLPSRPQAVLKRIIRKQLSCWVRNPHVLELLSLETQQDRDDLANLLVGMRPFFPKLACAIWECSPFVLLDEIVNKFMQSSTIFTFISRSKSGKSVRRLGIQQLSLVVKAACNRLQKTIQILRTPYHSGLSLLGLTYHDWITHIEICPTKIVHMVRQAVWKLDIKGITYPSLIDQNMLFLPEDLTLSEFGPQAENIATQIFLPRHRVYQTDDESDHYAACDKCVPWLGAETSTNLEFPEFDRNIRSPTLSKIMKLLALYRTGHYFGNQFLRIVRGLMAGLTHTSPDDLHVLVPEAGGGHLCHRVGINSFSLTTMPNYRPNISQIVTINNENVAILRTDTRNRTINFASRHFLLTVLAVWPLQSNCNLSITYPHIIESIYHGYINNQGRYALCDYCCNIVEDEPVTFIAKSMPSLIKYRELPLVGASQFEQSTLHRNMLDAIEHKTRRLLQDVNLNPADPIHRGVAFQTILKVFMSSKTSLYEKAKAAHYERIPQGQLLDIMGINLGVRGLQVQKISLRLIRAIPPRDLYECVVTEVFHMFLTWIGNDMTPLDTIKLSMIQGHHNPLAPFFADLGMSGQLQELTMGSRQSGVLSTPLTWPVGSASNGNIAFKAFFTQHSDLFEEWFYRATTPPFTKCYTRMEDNKSMIDFLTQLSESRFNLLAVRSIRLWREPRAYRRLSRMLKEDLANLYPDEPVEEADDATLDILTNGYLDMMTAYPQVDLLDVPSWIKMFAELIMMTFTLSIVDSGDLLTFADRPTVEIREVVEILSIPDDAAPNFTLLNPGIEERSPLWKQYIRMFGDRNAAHVWNIINKVGDAPGMLDWASAIGQQVFADLEAWVKCFGNITLIMLSKDGAVRLVDQFAQEQLGVRLDELRDRPQLNDLGLDNVIQNSYRCNRRHLPHHNVVMTPPITINANHINTLDLELQNLSMLTNQMDRSPQGIGSPWIDYRNLTRYSYTFNQACCHWLDILSVSGLMQYIHNVRGQCNVIILGDGTGAISDLVMTLNNIIEVVYCSLQVSPRDGGIVQDSATTNPPYQFLQGSWTTQDMPRLHWRGMYPGDVTDRGVQQMIIRKSAHLDGPCVGLISDIEMDWNQNVNPSWIPLFKSYVDLLYQIVDDSPFFLIKIPLSLISTVIRGLYWIRIAFNHLDCYYSRTDKSNLKYLYLLATEPNPVHFVHTVANRIIDAPHQVNPSFTALASLRALLLDPQLWNDDKALMGLNSRKPIFQVAASYRDFGLLPPNLKCLLERFFIPQPPSNIHFCQVTDSIKGKANILVEQLSLFEDEMRFNHAQNRNHEAGGYQRRVFAPTLGKRQQIIGEGATNLRDRLKRLVALHVLIAGLNQPLIGWDLRGGQFVNTVMRESLAMLQIWFEEHGRHYTLDLNTYNISVNTRIGKIELIPLLAEYTNLFIRFIGQLTHMSISLRHHPDYSLDTTRVWIPHCILEHCCYVYANNVIAMYDIIPTNPVNHPALVNPWTNGVIITPAQYVAVDTEPDLMIWSQWSGNIEPITSINDPIILPDDNDGYHYQWADEVEAELQAN